MQTLHSLFGLFVLTGIAWLLSEDRRAGSWRTAAVGMAVQLALAAVLLRIPASQQLFTYLNDLVIALQAATESGATFVFGYLGGGPLPFEERQPGASFVLAFRALPLVIVVSALTALLTHWRVLPWIVRGLSRALERSLGIGGAVGLGTAANVFVGMVEAPLFVRVYLRQLSRSELFMLMVAGMATIAGTVLILYATFVGKVLANAVGHLLIASLISAPAAITIARLMIPDNGVRTGATLARVSEARNSMDAITRGTLSGLQLYLNIVAMLLVFVALVHLANAVLGLLPAVGGAPVTLERSLGYLMAPVTWLMGIPWEQAPAAGALMGIKTVLNEFLAYLQFADTADALFDGRSRLILAYALCGFANFGSLGIMIGGLTTMVPERQDEIVGLGLKSIVAGTLATCCTGAVVGVVGQ